MAVQTRRDISRRVNIEIKLLLCSETSVLKDRQA